MYLEGRLRNRSWEVNGEKKYITEVDVEELTILTPRGQNGTGTSTGAPAMQSAPMAPAGMNEPAMDDDLPF